MKILHTADWHLGKRLERHDRGPEQALILEEICKIAEAENVDAVLVAGDLFDTFNPPTEATERFYKALKRLAKDGKRAVVAIAGNHDSPDRIEAPDPIARECGIIFAGYPNSQVPRFQLDSGLEVLRSDPGFIELKLPTSPDPLRLILVPYANEIRLKKDLGVEDSEGTLRNILQNHWKQLADRYLDDQGVNMMVAHLFMAREGSPLPDEPEDERSINIGGAQTVFTSNLPPQLQYVALGHLHRFQTIDQRGCPVVYSGSPLEYSFAEAYQEKHVVIVEANPGQNVTYEAIPLEKGLKLHRKTFEDIDLAVQWLEANQDTFVELSIISKDFLTSADRKRLLAAHERIIGPIPIITGTRDNHSPVPEVDLQKSMEELFKDYFHYKFGQDPNANLLELFREVMGTEVEG
ncbi:MAG: exonuclease subunit SbcD [Bacteroidia bacterium]|nr:exonuclease subunit SbcD [Bacteroidia bacterium]